MEVCFNEPDAAWSDLSTRKQSDMTDLDATVSRSKDGIQDFDNGSDSDGSVGSEHSLQETDLQLSGKPRNLYPNVVVASRSDPAELDSDEEDYQLRIHRRSDSGQGSSITDSSISTAHTEPKKMEQSGSDSPRELASQGDISDLGEGSSNSSPLNCYSDNAGRGSFDENVTEALKEIQVSKEEALARYRTGSLSQDRKSSQCSSVELDTDFTDIPLSNNVSPKAVNTYAPSSQYVGNNAASTVLRPPVITDKTPNARLFNKGKTSTWKVFSKKSVSSQNDSSPGGDQKNIAKSSPGDQRKIVAATSTTGLILENRPSHLPPKSAKEELKHRQLYQEMIQEAKKKELKDMQKMMKKEKLKHKQEDTIANSLRTWKEEIIPNWNSMKSTRKSRELWWYGLPPSIRGIVWKLAIGNELHITTELFKIFQVHYQQKLYSHKVNDPVATLHDSENSLVVSKENTVGLITLDVSRTFPSLCIFQKGGPYHESLKSLLGAYTCYRPDVGYVQGMSFLAAMLLLNMEPSDAFISFSNLLNNPCQMAFFMVDQPMMEAYFCTFDVLLEETLPRLHNHFFYQKLSHDIYLIDWIFTLYSKSLPLDVACRVWDLFFRDGEEFLFRTALGILNLHKDILLTMDFFHLAQYLTKLPDTISSDKLFGCIANINFSTQKFYQILAYQKKRLGRD